jgi:hypothetical protein
MRFDGLGNLGVYFLWTVKFTSPRGVKDSTLRLVLQELRGVLADREAPLRVFQCAMCYENAPSSKGNWTMHQGVGVKRRHSRYKPPPVKKE